MPETIDDQLIRLLGQMTVMSENDMGHLTYAEAALFITARDLIDTLLDVRTTARADAIMADPPWERLGRSLKDAQG